MPRAVASPDGLVVTHRLGRPDQDARSRVLVLDPDLRARERLRLTGEAGAVLAEGDEFTAFLGTRYAVIRRGNTTGGAELGQKWTVEAAVHDPARGQSWLFGWHKERIVTRRRALGNLSDEASVLPAAETERIAAAMDGAAGPVVAWRERGSTRIKTALFDGAAFAPHAEFEIGGAIHWDVVLRGARTLLVYYHRDDRTFKHVALRVRCCAGCGLPAPPDRLRFSDPILLLGRSVTGLAAAAWGDRLAVVLTRMTTLQAAAVPIDPAAGAPPVPLVSLGGEPLWHRCLAALLPQALLFFSFALIFLGFTLLRERGRSLFERLTPKEATGPPTADFLQRAMACILDLILLLPLLLVAVEFLNASPETSEIDPADPKWQAFFAIWYSLHVAYHFACEWATGRTLGKRILGLRVVGTDGGRVTFGGALVRNLVRILDGELLPPGGFLGAAAIMVTKRRQRLGDLAAGTLVIEDDRQPAAVRGSPLQDPPAPI